MKTLKSVVAGIELLDEKYPGWENVVDLETLDLGDQCGCVLGQIHKSLHPRSKDVTANYGRTRCDRLLDEWSIENPRQFGFMARSWNQGYERLTAMWEKAILAKRNGEQVTA